METLTTTDYSIFKRLSGNRDVTETRCQQIMRSIETVGWISNPILVNEKMEVIDGQGRLEALRRMHLPVEYRIVKGANISHCRAMNDVNKPWYSKEFIQSYAETGDEGYKMLWQCMTQYDVDLRTVLHLAGKRDTQERKIKTGEFIFTRQDFGKALTKLPIYSAYWKAMKRFTGHGLMKRKVSYFLTLHVPSYPHTRIVEALMTCDPNEIYCTSDERLIDCIEKVVNRNQRGENRLNLLMDYRSK